HHSAADASGSDQNPPASARPADLPRILLLGKDLVAVTRAPRAVRPSPGRAAGRPRSRPRPPSRGGRGSETEGIMKYAAILACGFAVAAPAPPARGQGHAAREPFPA